MKRDTDRLSNKGDDTRIINRNRGNFHAYSDQFLGDLDHATRVSLSLTCANRHSNSQGSSSTQWNLVLRHNDLTTLRLPRDRNKISLRVCGDDGRNCGRTLVDRPSLASRKFRWPHRSPDGKHPSFDYTAKRFDLLGRGDYSGRATAIADVILSAIFDGDGDRRVVPLMEDGPEWTGYLESFRAVVPLRAHDSYEQGWSQDYVLWTNQVDGPYDFLMSINEPYSAKASRVAAIHRNLYPVHGLNVMEDALSNLAPLGNETPLKFDTDDLLPMCVRGEMSTTTLAESTAVAHLAMMKITGDADYRGASMSEHNREDSTRLGGARVAVMPKLMGCYWLTSTIGRRHKSHPLNWLPFPSEEEVDRLHLTAKKINGDQPYPRHLVEVTISYTDSGWILRALQACYVMSGIVYLTKESFAFQRILIALDKLIAATSTFPGYVYSTPARADGTHVLLEGHFEPEHLNVHTDMSKIYSILDQMAGTLHFWNHYRVVRGKLRHIDSLMDAAIHKKASIEAAVDEVKAIQQRALDTLHAIINDGRKESATVLRTMDISPFQDGPQGVEDTILEIVEMIGAFRIETGVGYSSGSAGTRQSPKTKMTN